MIKKTKIEGSCLRDIKAVVRTPRRILQRTEQGLGESPQAREMNRGQGSPAALVKDAPVINVPTHSPPARE